jgi:hypothetical protein
LPTAFVDNCLHIVADQRLGSRLCVDLMTLDVKSKHLQILRFLRRILDGFLGSLVEWVKPNAFVLGFSDVARERVELAGQRRLMSGRNSGQRPQLRRTHEISPRELGCRWGKINPTWYCHSSLMFGARRGVLIPRTVRCMITVSLVFRTDLKYRHCEPDPPI